MQYLQCLKPFAAIAFFCLANASVASAQSSSNLPDALSYFAVAEAEANSPQIVEFDESWLITGKVSEFGAKATEGENWQLAEGKVIFAYYRFPKGISALQIQREYESHLKERGYSVAFSCATERGDCFIEKGPKIGVSLGNHLDKPKNMPSLDKQKMSLVRNYFHGGGARYTYATKGTDDAGEKIAVALADTPEKGVMAITKSIISGNPTPLTSSSNMLTELKEKKSVSLDNLLFDVNSDILLPPSRDQIFEIAMMMREDPSIKLQVIGHTDSDGKADFNLDLSKRRAASVVRALVEGFDIDANRLTSDGKGLSEPLASNDTKEGKAKNRRVELKLM